MTKDMDGFTLIELLVVVAIIGILAAVGVVAYSGYTTSAKNNSVKQIHKNIAKFMAAEIQKCSIGSEVILNKLVSNQVTAQPDLCPKINNWTDPNSAFIASAFENHFKAVNWKTHTQHKPMELAHVVLMFLEKMFLGI